MGRFGMTRNLSQMLDARYQTRHTEMGSVCRLWHLASGVWPSVSRQNERKSRPFLGLGFNFDSAAKQFGESARDVEAETGPPVPAGEARVELRERLEQAI